MQGIVALIEACIAADPQQRPTAAQALQLLKQHG